MRRLFLHLLVCCMVSGSVCGQVDSSRQEKQDTVQPKPASDSVQKAGTDTAKPVRKAVPPAGPNNRKPDPVRKPLAVSQASRPRVRASGRSARSILDSLDQIMIRLRKLNTYEAATDTEAVEEGAGEESRQSEGTHLRVVFVDSNSRPPVEDVLTFRLTNNLTYADILKDSSKYLEGNLLTNRDAWVIQLYRPGLKQDSVPQAAGTAQPASSGSSDLLRQVTLLLAVIGSLVLLFFAVNKFGKKGLHQNRGFRKEPPQRQYRRTVVPPPTPQQESSPVPKALPEQQEMPMAVQEQQPTSPLEAAAVVAAVQKPAEQPVSAPAGRGKYFLAEVLTTAGPRKKFMSEPDADKDLGEDVCGFLASSREILLWLLDGTSDLFSLKNPVTKQEYFSSRLLAQAVAAKLRASFTGRDKQPLNAVLEQAVEDVRADWLSALAGLPEQEQALLHSNIERKNLPECATTLLFVQLSIDGQFTAYRSGDSKTLVYSSSGGEQVSFEQTSLNEKNEQSLDRLFFRLTLNEKKEFDILYNRPNHELVSREGVQAVVVFSDGIGVQTEQLLQQQYAERREEIRKAIIYQTQGTADDKSIGFIEIREEP